MLFIISVAIWSYTDITRLPWSLFYEKWMKPLYAQHGMPSIIRSDLKALIDQFDNVFPLTAPVHLGEIIHPTILVSEFLIVNHSSLNIINN